MTISAALLLFGALLFIAAGPEQSGYLTGAPVPDWMGLATDTGRDAVMLGDGCAAAAPGTNVVIIDVAHVQIVDALAGPRPDTCALTRREHMSDVPCARNPAGLCDVAFE